METIQLINLIREQHTQYYNKTSVKANNTALIADISHRSENGKETPYRY